MTDKQPLSILVVDDDPDDRLLIGDAFRQTNLAGALAFVEDGQALLDYLRHQGPFAEGRPPRPGLVMLDLNIPGKDGREALADMKADPALRGIPVVVLTTSTDEEDVMRSYELGVSGFVHKPASYAALLEMVTVIGKYWTEVVALPLV